MRECRLCGWCGSDRDESCPEHGAELVSPFLGEAILASTYRLERRLGLGGMGAVYRAVHEGLGKAFAVKLVRLDVVGVEDAVQRFHREALALGRLDHPNIIRVTDFGVDPRGIPYLVMDLLTGEDLGALLRRRGPLPAREALGLLHQLAAGLTYAHQCGILHRDLKPTNVFLTRDGSHVTARLLDFGLARPAPAATPTGGPAAATGVVSEGREDNEPTLVLPETAPRPARAARPGSLPLPPPAGDRFRTSADVTVAGTLLGTPEYVAPELIRREPATTASDVYAFGVVAYEMFVGRRPFEGPLPQVLSAHLDALPPPPSELRAGLPRDLDAPLLAALSKEPGRRPPTPAAVVRAVATSIESVDEARIRRWARPRRLAAAAVISLAAATLSWGAARISALRIADLRATDLLFRLLPRRVPDPRVTVVTIDEPSMQQERQMLSEMADDVAGTIHGLLAGGARAVAVDLLLPAAWGRNPAFADALLLHADHLVLASFSSQSGNVFGTEVLTPQLIAALGADRAERLFAFANLGEDVDGAVRSYLACFPTSAGHPRLSLAGRLAALDGTGAAGGPCSDAARRLDLAIDLAAIHRISWREVAATSRRGELVPGALVLIGAELEGLGDVFRNPMGGSPKISGLMVQAVALDSLLSGRQLRDLSAGEKAGIVAAVAFLLFVVLARGCRASVTLAALAAIGPLLVTLSLILLWGGGLVLPVVSTALGVAVPAAAALPAGRWLARPHQADRPEEE